MTKRDGLPCVRCGTSEWYDSGNCKKCSYERVKKWQNDNLEDSREHSRKWRRNNPGKVRQQCKLYYQRHSEKVKKRTALYQKANPEKRVATVQRRRAREAQVGGSYTVAEWEALCKQYDYCCLACGRKRRLTVDHIIPLISGGSNDISNIQPLCKSCNSRKHDKIIDYRTKPGILRWIQEKLL